MLKLSFIITLRGEDYILLRLSRYDEICENFGGGYKESHRELIICQHSPIENKVLSTGHNICKII